MVSAPLYIKRHQIHTLAQRRVLGKQMWRHLTGHVAIEGLDWLRRKAPDERINSAMLEVEHGVGTVEGLEYSSQYILF